MRRAFGGGLISKYGDMASILRVAYPNYEWNWKLLLSQSKKTSQRILALAVQDLFPEDEVIEDYFCKEASRESGFHFEIDLFIPSRRLGFEYHGRHHYEDIPQRSSLENQQRRDEEKKRMCERKNISLIVVPYWWDYKTESLIQIIRSNTTLDVKD